MTTSRPVAQAVESARKTLEKVDPEQPSEALPLLRAAAESLTRAIDEAMAAVLLTEGGTLREAGRLAGLTENAVGPRLARTRSLASYTSETGRVTARGVERALYDLERGEHRAPTYDETAKPLRFKPRRTRPD